MKVVTREGVKRAILAVAECSAEWLLLLIVAATGLGLCALTAWLMFCATSWLITA